MNAGPLQGIRILDLTTALSGPLAISLLADLGAEVIKFESPANVDVVRVTGSRRNGMTSIFHLSNRGKRSIVVDLRVPEGQEVFRRLVARSDVVAQNFRPGVADRIGVGYESCRAVRADVIYLSISGFGETGPLAQTKVFDNLIQAAAGIADVQGADGAPVYVRQLMCDKATAYTAANAVTAALFARQREAGGQHLRISMLDASIAFLWPDAGAAEAMLEPDATIHLPGRSFEIAALADGYVTSAPVSDAEFQGWCDAYGASEVAADPQFATHQDRMTNDDFPAARRDVMARGASFSLAEMTQRLAERDVPSAPVLSLGELAEHPQTTANGTFAVREHPQLGRIREVNPPVHFSATPCAAGRDAPALGQHTDEILSEVGYSAADIERLRAVKAIP